MKAPISISVLLLVTTIPGRAVADSDERTACFDAAEKGQALRVAHKLVEARDLFRRCAASTCPTSVQSDCSGWLDQAEKAIPTVVLSAKDAVGNDLFDVNVTVDGQPLATKLDGAAVPVNPGPHSFRFRSHDGMSVERQVLVSEGQKDLVVGVRFARSDQAPPAKPAPPPPPPPPAPISPTPSAAPASQAGIPWHTVGWIVGAGGVAGLALGAIFTGITLSDKSSANCNAAKQCTNLDSIDSAKSAAPIAGAGLIGGGALAVTGALLVLLTRPTSESSRGPSGILAAPMLGPHVAGAFLSRPW
jgi:hypothetical protein